MENISEILKKYSIIRCLLSSENYSSESGNLERYVDKLNTDKATLEKFKTDPIGELKKIDIDIDPNSEVGKQLMNTAGGLKPGRKSCWLIHWD